MKDDGAYRRFTGKAEFEKIFNTLIGLIEGIVIDAKINDVEMGFLQSWLDAQRARAQKHPFNEIVPLRWAYACYGRKVERAVELRKEGHPIVIVHEKDFHDAVVDFLPSACTNAQEPCGGHDPG